jgi:hypothetical protein
MSEDAAVSDSASGASNVTRTAIKAGDLTQEHVGEFVECHDPTSGIYYGAEILRIMRRDEGKAPGVSIWLQHPTLRSGRLGRQGQAHVRFDEVFQLLGTPVD